MRRNVLKDRSGKISGAIAALLAIIVVLIYTRVASTPKGSEDAFYTVYGALKWFLKALDLQKYVEEYLKEFEEFLKYVQGTPLWPLTISILALVVMELAVMVIYCGTWMTIDTTTSILGWVNGVRTRRQGERGVIKKSDTWLGIYKITALVGKLKGLRLPKKAKGFTSGISNVKEKVPRPKASSQFDSIIEKKQEAWKEPLVIQWWHIPYTQTITLKKGILGDLIKMAKSVFPTRRNPEGSNNELAKAISVHRSHLFRIVTEGKDSITVENLLKLLDVIEMPYDALTPYIKSVGGRGDKEAILNPKFPIDMYSPDGARLLAAALKDGDITRAEHHFEYINYNRENLRIVTESIKKVFGDVEPTILYEPDGKQKGIHFQSALIGDALLRAGAIAGRKTDQDYNLPPMIWFGNYEVKKAYFEQAIRDDGGIDKQAYHLIITGAREIKSKVKQEDYRLFDRLTWNPKTLPSGAKESFVTLSNKLRDELPDELKPAYDNFLLKMTEEWVPTILKEEAQILERTFGVTVKVEPKEIYRGKRGLRGRWSIIVSGKKDFNNITGQLDDLGK